MGMYGVWFPSFHDVSRPSTAPRMPPPPLPPPPPLASFLFLPSGPSLFTHLQYNVIGLENRDLEPFDGIERYVDVPCRLFCCKTILSSVSRPCATGPKLS